MTNESVVAAAGRNRRNVVQKTTNALDWESTSETLHCCCGFRPFYTTGAAFLFLLVSHRRFITGKLSKLLKPKWHQSRPGTKSLTTTITAPRVDVQRASELLIQPLWNLCRIWISTDNFFFVKEGVLYAGSGTLNTQSLHEEGAREAVFC